MKILSIKLKNINSLQGEWEVDFTQAPLKDAGIFAIVGATGSGKSTLLDCITLALFNKVPRLGTISKQQIANSGWILTRHERDCFAEIKYSCKTGLYTSRWSISKIKKGDGFQDYAMQVYNENGEPLTDKKGEVPAKNAALIGLNYEQFIKAILLSQGEFAKFLQSDTKEKAKLLEEITGQKDYRRLGKRTFEYHKKLKEEVDQQEHIAAEIKMHLLTEENHLLLKDEINQLEETLQLLKASNLTISQQIAIKKQIEGFQKTIDTRKTSIDKYTNEISQFNTQYADTLKNYEHLLPHKSNINEFMRLTAEDAEQTHTIQVLQDKMAIKQVEIDGTLGKIAALLQSKVTKDDYLDQLEDFKTNVLGKMQQKKQVQQSVSTNLTKVKNLLTAAIFSGERKLFNPSGNNASLLAQLNSRIANNQQQIADFCAQNDLQPSSIGERLTYLRQQQLDLTQLESFVNDYLRIIEKIQKQSKEEAAATEKGTSLTQQLAELGIQEKVLSQQFAEAEKERDHLLSVKKLEQYRNELVEGEACPLCGSEVHPYISAYMKDLSAIATVHDQLKAKVEKVKLDIVKAEQELEGTKRESDRCKKEMGESELEKQKRVTEINRFKEKYQLQEIKSIATVQALNQACTDALKKADACNTWILDLPPLAQLLEEVDQLDKNAADFNQLNLAINQLYTGKDIEVDARHLRETMGSATTALQEAAIVQHNTRSSNAIAQKQLQDISNQTLEPLLALGFDSIQVAKKALIEEIQYQQLADRRNGFVSQLQTENRLLEENLLQLAKEKQLDDATKTSLELISEAESMEMKIGEAEHHLVNKRNQVYSHEQRAAELQQKEVFIKQLIEKKYPFELLNRQIGDANGDKFNKYAQQLSLRHLLTFANLRLQKINNRYHLRLKDVLTDAEIEVEDSFMAFERRSVKTLSGGETFMVSLAMALGLSDLASKDIRIESLFIDEGFGTLDPDTLEDAIATLEQLQSESNKLVGIISHVDSLKERIYTQLIIEKQNNGYSKMTITPQA